VDDVGEEEGVQDLEERETVGPAEDDADSRRLLAVEEWKILHAAIIRITKTMPCVDEIHPAGRGAILSSRLGPWCRQKKLIRSDRSGKKSVRDARSRDEKRANRKKMENLSPYPHF